MKVSKRKFSKLYDQNVEKIYRFVFVKTGTKETAEDLTSQAFLKCWQKFSSGLEVDNPLAYIFKTARHEVADYYRRQAKIKIITASQAPDIASSENSPEQKQVQASDFEAVQASLAELKQDYQNVLVMRYTNGLPIKKISQIMEKSQGAVKVMIHRALKQLKEKL